jgi:microcystin degradation protein MlrC
MSGHAPFQGRFTVVALSDGAFEATGPFYAGNRLQLGRMAVLRLGGVRVVLSSRKQQLADQAMLAHLGIDPKAQRIIALKSSVHFRADFEPIAEAVLVVEAPGPNTADPKKLPYRHLRRGLRLGPLGPAFAG